MKENLLEQEKKVLNLNKDKTNSNSTSQKLFNTIQQKKISFNNNNNLNEFLTINNNNAIRVPFLIVSCRLFLI